MSVHYLLHSAAIGLLLMLCSRKGDSRKPPETVAYPCSRNSGREEAHATAKVEGQTTNARLRTSIFRSFCGNFRILVLGSDYNDAEVCHPRQELSQALSAASPSLQQSRTTFPAMQNIRHFAYRGILS
jgi:lipocalin